MRPCCCHAAPPLRLVDAPLYVRGSVRILYLPCIAGDFVRLCLAERKSLPASVALGLGSYLGLIYSLAISFGFCLAERKSPPVGCIGVGFRAAFLIEHSEIRGGPIVSIWEAPSIFAGDFVRLLSG